MSEWEAVSVQVEARTQMSQLKIYCCRQLRFCFCVTGWCVTQVLVTYVRKVSQIANDSGEIKNSHALVVNMENEFASECLPPNIYIGISSKMWGHSQTLPLYHTYLVNKYYLKKIKNKKKR